jgi:hypothetical protein
VNKSEQKGSGKRRLRVSGCSRHEKFLPENFPIQLWDEFQVILLLKDELLRGAPAGEEFPLDTALLLTNRGARFAAPPQ